MSFSNRFTMEMDAPAIIALNEAQHKGNLVCISVNDMGIGLSAIGRPHWYPLPFLFFLPDPQLDPFPFTMFESDGDQIANRPQQVNRLRVKIGTRAGAK